MKKILLSLALVISSSIIPLFATIQLEAGGGYSFMGVCDNLYLNTAFFFTGENPRMAIKEREEKEAKYNGAFSKNSDKLYKYYTNSSSSIINNFGLQIHLGFSPFTLPLCAIGESGERFILGLGVIDRINFDKDNAISLSFDFFGRGFSKIADVVFCIGASYTRTILDKHIISAGLVLGLDRAVNSEESGVSTAMPGFGFNLRYGFKLI